jgi:hypothetical protein
VESNRGNAATGCDAISDTRKYGRVDFQIRSGRGELRVAGTPDSHDTSISHRQDQTSGTWGWLTHHLPSESQTVVQS